jgi:hypothetical protein
MTGSALSPAAVILAARAAHRDGLEREATVERLKDLGLAHDEALDALAAVHAGWNRAELDRQGRAPDPLSGDLENDPLFLAAVEEAKTK